MGRLARSATTLSSPHARLGSTRCDSRSSSFPGQNAIRNSSCRSSIDPSIGSPGGTRGDAFDREYEWSDGFDEYVEAASGKWLDQSVNRGVTFIGPGGAVFSSQDAPLTLEVHDEEPPLDQLASSIGDFDLWIRSGALVLEESGGGDGQRRVIAGSRGEV